MTIYLFSVSEEQRYNNVFNEHNTSQNGGSWEDKGRLLRTYSIHSVIVVL